MGIFDFLKPKQKEKFNDTPDTSVFIDFHSHLLPGIDDGCITIDLTLEILKDLKTQGITKIITTPHIISDLYPNTSEIIKSKHKEVCDLIEQENLQLELHAAAEYYLDEWFLKNYKSLDLLTFGSKYLLVETNYVDKPPFLEEIFFELLLDGYQVIFAHPERYHYLLNDFKSFETLHDIGILFQSNMLSFTGYYSPQIKKAAEYLLKNNMIDMLGSDIHKLKHAQIIKKFKCSETYQTLIQKQLLNNKLLD